MPSHGIMAQCGNLIEGTARTLACAALREHLRVRAVELVAEIAAAKQVGARGEEVARHWAVVGRRSHDARQDDDAGDACTPHEIVN